MSAFKRGLKFIVHVLHIIAVVILLCLIFVAMSSDMSTKKDLTISIFLFVYAIIISIVTQDDV